MGEAVVHIEVQNYGDRGTLLPVAKRRGEAVVHQSTAESVVSFFGMKSGTTALFLTGGHWNYRLDGCFILEGSNGKIEIRPHHGWQPLIQLWKKESGLGNLTQPTN